MLRDDDAEVVVGTKFDEEYFKSRNVGFSATAIFTDIGKEPRQCTIERIIGETESGRTELGYSVSFKGGEVLTCFDSYTTTSLLLNYDCYRIIDMLQPGNVSRARVGSQINDSRWMICATLLPLLVSVPRVKESWSFGES